MFPSLFATQNNATHTFVLGSVAMATRLVHPIRSSGRRGWRGPVSDARGRVRSGLGRSTAGTGFGILADLARGVRGSGPSSTPTRITRLPSLLPRLDALDGRQGPGRRPGAECPLRSFNGSSSHGSVPRLDLNGLGRRWEAALAALDAEMDAGDADDTAVDNGTVRVRKAPAMQRRKPTPLQTARWNTVQKAKRRGLSIREVARKLGIHRATAKKYMEAVSPPIKRDRVG